MSDRSCLRVPSYRAHRQSGQAVVTLSDGFGQRRDMLLGRHGTAESRQEYARIIAEWEARGRRLPAPGGASPDFSVNELIDWLGGAPVLNAALRERRRDAIAHCKEKPDPRAHLLPLDVPKSRRAGQFHPNATPQSRCSIEIGWLSRPNSRVTMHCQSQRKLETCVPSSVAQSPKCE
jgi:hypothetical protein